MTLFKRYITHNAIVHYNITTEIRNWYDDVHDNYGKHEKTFFKRNLSTKSNSTRMQHIFDIASTFVDVTVDLVCRYCILFWSEAVLVQITLSNRATRFISIVVQEAANRFQAFEQHKMPLNVKLESRLPNHSISDGIYANSCLRPRLSWLNVWILGRGQSTLS